MKRILSLAAILVSVLALTAPPAAADMKSRNDPNDTPGRLDLSRVGHKHADGQVVTYFRTYGEWSPDLLRAGTGNRFLLTVKHGDFVGTAEIYRKNGRWWCNRHLAGEPAMACSNLPGNVSVSHPNAHTLVIKNDPPADWNAYSWRAGTRFVNDGRCSDVCRDFAPRRGSWILHEL